MWVCTRDGIPVLAVDTLEAARLVLGIESSVPVSDLDIDGRRFVDLHSEEWWVAAVEVSELGLGDHRQVTVMVDVSLSLRVRPGVVQEFVGWILAEGISLQGVVAIVTVPVERMSHD